MTLKASKTLKKSLKNQLVNPFNNPFTLKSHHLIVSAAAFSILATTSALWAQSGSMAAPAAHNMGASANSQQGQQAKPLSVEELVAAFTKADVNKDGKLSRAEAENVPGLGPKFDQIDANADQFVSKVEFENAIR